jgi:hypothetical protein
VRVERVVPLHNCHSTVWVERSGEIGRIMAVDRPKPSSFTDCSPLSIATRSYEMRKKSAPIVRIARPFRR